MVCCLHSCLPPAQTYPRVGRVVGRFYDEGGLPTAALAEVRTKAEDGKELKVCVWLLGTAALLFYQWCHRL